VQKRHRGSDWAWIVIVGTDSDPHTAPYDALFNAERVPLRKKVAAALKTCGQWPENWRHDAE
jgi:hypothetical protein